MYLDDILVLTYSKHAGKRVWTFCVLYWFVLEYILFFHVWALSHSAPFFLWLCWDTWEMSVSLPSNKPSWDTLVGSCFGTEATYYISIFGGQNHLLYKWTCTISPLVLCHSEWHVECLSFSSLFFSFFTPSLLAQCPLWRLSQSLCDVGVTEKNYAQSFWLIFSGFWVSLTHSGTCSGLMCKVDIALSELQAVVLMLHKMTFQLSGKVVAIHLDNITAKAYYIIKIVFFPD